MAETTTFRVFVSSTFRDLQNERNHLDRYVFPALRELCARHGARFQPIDLRWGVSREASLDQQAMNVCLDEIERCRQVTPRPNFIVLLGNRHGWLAPPAQIAADEFEDIRKHVAAGENRVLLDQWYRRDGNAVPPEYVLCPREVGGPYEDDDVWQPVEQRLHTVLADAACRTPYAADPKYHSSATEREILAGALGPAALDGRAFCFVRELREHPDPREAAAGDPVLDFVDTDQAPVDALKARLRDALPYFEYESNWDARTGRPSTDHLDALADDVRRVLSEAIVTALEGPPLPATGDGAGDSFGIDPALDTEGRAHEAFASDRCRTFVGRGDELAAISRYLHDGDGTPFTVIGEGGTGKSALLAEAVRRARHDHTRAQVVHRFLGATPASSDGLSLLASLCRELARRAGADETTVPTDFQQLTADLPERLKALGDQKPTFVFLDSLDQLLPSHGARSLAWLPFTLPDGVRMIVSTRPGDTRSALERRGGQVLELGPMVAGDGRELVHRWLEEAHRTLQPTQETEVVEKFEASNGNPLYLRLAFQEARRWRSNDEPESLATGVEAMIERHTFGRLAKDENHGEVLVSGALGYLAASRHGLAEDELVDLLSRDPDVVEWFLRGAYHALPESAGGRRLPVVLWSRLAFDLRPYLAERAAEGATLITFFHRELLDVAIRRFLGDAAPKYHSRLADYFFPEEPARWSEASLRSLSELPFHLIRAERWDDVEATLTDFDFLEAKASRVAIERRVDGDGNEVVTYEGVRQLEVDFDLALQAIGGGVASERPRPIVTVTDFGEGFVLRCPHCSTLHEFSDKCGPCAASHDLTSWLGQDVTCPFGDCGGPLRVNSFTAGARERPRPAAPVAPEPAKPTAEPVTEPAQPADDIEASQPTPGLPPSTGARKLVEEMSERGASGVNQWWSVVLHRFAPMVESLAPGLEAASLAAEVAARLRDGDIGAPLGSEHVVAAAARRARRLDKDRVSERDVVAAVIEAAGHAVRDE